MRKILCAIFFLTGNFDAISCKKCKNIAKSRQKMMPGIGIVAAERSNQNNKKSEASLRHSIAAGQSLYSSPHSRWQWQKLKDVALNFCPMSLILTGSSTI